MLLCCLRWVGGWSGVMQLLVLPGQSGIPNHVQALEKPLG